MDFDMNAANIAMLEGNVASARPLEEMFSVKGKVAIVTGGTSGLGFNIVLRLLQGGANVMIAGSSEAKGAYTLPVLEKAGFGPDRVAFCKTNVTKDEDMQNLINATDAKFGTIDIFVNSAAVWSYAHVYDLSSAEFRRVMDTNVTGAFLGVKYVSQYMIAHQVQGKITLISSNCAWMPYPVFGGYPHYAASKGAVNAFVIESAKELKRYGIMVNGVAPGGMVTAGSSSNMCAKDLDEDKADEFYDELMVWQIDEVPPVDTVAIVAYALTTPMSDGMTGEIVVADGGSSHNIFRRQVEIEAYPPEE